MPLFKLPLPHKYILLFYGDILTEAVNGDISTLLTQIFQKALHPIFGYDILFHVVTKKLLEVRPFMVGQTGMFMKGRKDRTDDAVAPSRREDEGQREKEVHNGR
jgi:hypothetical protein